MKVIERTAVVAIVGRPNVGKSALVNRLSQMDSAIVSPIEGVTRDRNYLQTEWTGRRFTIVDTGGISADKDETTESIREQAMMAIEEADVIVFVMDRFAGIMPGDTEIADLLRRTHKPVIPVVNKVDDPGLHKEGVTSFYEIGLSEPIQVSALHGLGTGDLLDEVVSKLPEDTEEVSEDEVSIAIVGRPNVGKSSLLNRIIGSDRSVVSPIPGTTRDAVDSVIDVDGVRYRFIDTAGIRRRGRGIADLEFYGWVRAVRALERADIALFLIDAFEGATEMDQKVAELIEKRKCGIVVLMNKWDLLKGDPEAQERCEKSMQRRLWFFPHVPYLNISAGTSKGMQRLFPAIQGVSEEFSRRISTGKMNRFLDDFRKTNRMPSKKGRSLRVEYGTQVSAAPPSFVIFVNDTNLASSGFKTNIERQIREEFGFSGAPVLITFRESS